MAEPILYHGDEIEVYRDETTWNAKKVLRIVKRQWRWLLFVIELKVDNPNAPSFVGIFIDEAEEPIIEIPVSATEYELFDKSIDTVSWGIGTHLIEVKLRSDGGGIYNRLFEVYTILPPSVGSVVKTS